MMCNINNYLIILCCLLFASARITGQLHEKYVGCFEGNGKKPKSEIVLQGANNLTIDICIQKCQNETKSIKTFAALTGGVTCLCGDDYGQMSPDTDCQVPCAGNNQQYCGGRNMLDGTPIYVVFTARSLQRQYIGCYKDNQTRAMERNLVWIDGKNSTIESCIRICDHNNYKYAGMQYSYECFCGDSYDRYGPLPESGCDMTCSGNRGQICGGPHANSVCAVKDKLWCSRDTDCKSNERCNVIDLKYMNVSRCRCKQGFHRMTIREHCTDIDECQSDTSTCDPKSEICLNSIGSHRCICKDGFLLTSGNCEDRDECINNSLICDAERELCKNTYGSYKCQCKPGYENTSTDGCTDIDECQSGTSLCDSNSATCFNSIGSYRCECKYGFTLKNGKCIECNCTTTTGIILGAFLAVSLLVNAILIFSRTNSANSKKPETGKSVAQPEFEPASIRTSDQREINCYEAPEPGGRSGVYEQINMKQRRAGLNPTSEYAELINQKELTEEVYMNY